MARGRVKIALGNQVLQHVNQSSARVGTGVHVNYIIRTTKLKQRLSLQILLKKQIVINKMEDKNRVK